MEEKLVGARGATALDIPDVDDEGQPLAIHLFKESLGFAFFLDGVGDIPEKPDLELRHARLARSRGSLLPFVRYTRTILTSASLFLQFAKKSEAGREGDQPCQDQGYG